MYITQNLFKKINSGYHLLFKILTHLKYNFFNIHSQNINHKGLNSLRIRTISKFMHTYTNPNIILYKVNYCI